MQDEVERIAMVDLAAHHERQGLFHARQAANNAPWYHEHGTDTRRAADHFAVAAALRAQLQEQTP